MNKDQIFTRKNHRSRLYINNKNIIKHTLTVFKKMNIKINVNKIKRKGGLSNIPVEKGLLKVEILRYEADFDAHNLNAIFYSPNKTNPSRLICICQHKVTNEFLYICFCKKMFLLKFFLVKYRLQTKCN